LGPEALVEHVDELRQRDSLMAWQTAADLGGPVKATCFTLTQRNRALCDLLKPVVLEPHVVIELVRGPGLPPGQLRRQMPEEHVELLEVRVLVRDDLTQERIEVAEPIELSAPG